MRNGELVNATIVLSALGGVYGTVSLAGGDSTLSDRLSVPAPAPP